MSTSPAHDPFWWLTALRVFLVLHLMAFAAWPWFTRCFNGLRDRGAAAAMSGGVFVYLFFSMLWWRTGWFELRFVWTVLLMVCVGACGHSLFLKPVRPSNGTRALMRKSFLQGWLIFTLLFWYWAWIRTGDPSIIGTEKTMDMMWMQSALSSDQPPIKDAWFGGEAASYYAEGHQALAFLGLKLGLPPQSSVNMTQIIWFALTGLLAFVGGKTFFEITGRKKGTCAGLLTMLFVCFFSTPQGFFSIQKPLGEPWWWSPSRVISDGETELITEFPFFSFWLGDNHAHVIGLPLLLLAVLSSLALFRSRKISYATLLIPVTMVFVSWKINPWQVPLTLALLFSGLLLKRFQYSKALIFAMGLTLLTGLLFLFPSRIGGPEIEIGLNRFGHTGIPGFFRVFGFLIPGVLLLALLRPHRLIYVLILIGLGMYLGSELFYLKDLFNSRMNTVFKIYYQLWILLSLLSAAGWAGLLANKKKGFSPGWIPLILILYFGLGYSATLTQEAGQRRKVRQSLDAWSVYDPDTQNSLGVLSRLVKPGDRIAEAPSQAYDFTGSFYGTWTKGSTLIGWLGHQQQWRKDLQVPDLSFLYEADSPFDLSATLNVLDVDWVVVGPNEKRSYEPHPDFLSWMDRLAYRVVDQEDLKIFQIR